MDISAIRSPEIVRKELNVYSAYVNNLPEDLQKNDAFIAYTNRVSELKSELALSLMNISNETQRPDIIMSIFEEQIEAARERIIKQQRISLVLGIFLSAVIVLSGVGIVGAYDLGAFGVSELSVFLIGSAMLFFGAMYSFLRISPDDLQRKIQDLIKLETGFMAYLRLFESEYKDKGDIYQIPETVSEGVLENLEEKEKL